MGDGVPPVLQAVRDRLQDLDVLDDTLDDAGLRTRVVERRMLILGLSGPVVQPVTEEPGRG